MTRRALVTGASGFVGAAICRELLAQGYYVRALLRKTSDPWRLEALDLDIVFGCLEDEASLGRAAKGQQVVFHNAAALGDWGDYEAFAKVNVGGTRTLLAVSADAGVARFVHMSSLSALRLPTDGSMVNETTPYAAMERDAYTRTKIESERAVLAWRGQGAMEVVVLRPGAVWGPGDPTFLPRFERFAERHMLFTVGRGENRVGLSHVRNLASAARLAGDAEGVAGEVLHITDDEGVPARHLFATLAAALGYDSPRAAIPRGLAEIVARGAELLSRTIPAMGPPLMSCYAVRLLGCDARFDCTKARRLMGYEPVVDFASGVAEIAHAAGTLERTRTEGCAPLGAV